MSRDINNQVNHILKNNDDIYKTDHKMLSQVNNLSIDIENIKKQIETIDSKVDRLLELLNVITFFIEDAENIAEEDDLEAYESNEGWLPEVSEWEKQYDDNDDEEDI